MSNPTVPLLAAALAFTLAACSPQPPEPADPPEGVVGVDPADTTMPPTADAGEALEPAAPGMVDSCDAGAVQSLIGQEATEAVVEQARIDAGAETARTLRPGEVVTMEYREGRLNVDVDDDGTITSLRCG